MVEEKKRNFSLFLKCFGIVLLVFIISFYISQQYHQKIGELHWSKVTDYIPTSTIYGTASLGLIPWIFMTPYTLINIVPLIGEASTPETLINIDCTENFLCIVIIPFLIVLYVFLFLLYVVILFFVAKFFRDKDKESKRKLTIVIIIIWLTFISMGVWFVKYKYVDEQLNLNIYLKELQKISKKNPLPEDFFASGWYSAGKRNVKDGSEFVIIVFSDVESEFFKKNKSYLKSLELRFYTSPQQISGEEACKREFDEYSLKYHEYVESTQDTRTGIWKCVKNTGGPHIREYYSGFLDKEHEILIIFDSDAKPALEHFVDYYR